MVSITVELRYIIAKVRIRKMKVLDDLKNSGMREITAFSMLKRFAKISVTDRGAIVKGELTIRVWETQIVCRVI